jgi:hypothetical protein
MLSTMQIYLKGLKTINKMAKREEIGKECTYENTELQIKTTNKPFMTQFCLINKIEHLLESLPFRGGG